MNKFKELFGNAKDRFFTLPKNLQVFAGIIAALLLISIVMGLFNKADRAVNSEPVNEKVTIKMSDRGRLRKRKIKHAKPVAAAVAA